MTRKLMIALLLVLGIATQLVTVVPSGSRYCADDTCGIFYWGANEHDAVWHLAVARSSFQRETASLPNMAHENLKNYNYLIDTLINATAKFTGLAPIFVLHKLLPAIIVGLFIVTTIKLASLYGQNKYFLPSLLFFNFFGSSFSYLITLFQNGTIWGSSSILSMQAGQNMLNLQFAASLVLLNLSIILISAKKRTFYFYIKFSLIIFLTFGLKFYSGVAVLTLLGVDYALKLLRSRKIALGEVAGYSLILLITFLSLVIFYKPTGGVASFPFVLKPFATVVPIIEDRTLVYMPTFARELYNQKGLSLLLLQLMILGIFIFFNFGSRLIVALLTIRDWARTRMSDSERAVIATSAIVGIISILFVQKGVWWNTVQFLYISLFLANIVVAKSLSMLFNKQTKLARSLVVIILLLTLPSNLDIWRNFSHFPGNSYIHDKEIEALNFLSTQKRGIVLTDDFYRVAVESQVPRLTLNYDTSYIAAFSGQQTYLADLIQLELLSVDYTLHLAKVKNYDCELLSETDYIFELTDRRFKDEYDKCNRPLVQIFGNDLVNIYSIY